MATLNGLGPVPWACSTRGLRSEDIVDSCNVVRVNVDEAVFENGVEGREDEVGYSENLKSYFIEF